MLQIYKKYHNSTLNFTINLNGNAYTGVAQLDQALGNIVIDAQKMQSWFEKTTSAVGAGSIKSDAFIGVVGKVTQAFQTMVGTSLDFEQQQANPKTLLNGDAEATENLVKQIREYGKATVYDRGGLVEAQKTMMAFGLDADFAFGKLKNIGDIALGDSQKMQSLALAFSQATSSGKLKGVFFNPFLGYILRIAVYAPQSNSSVHIVLKYIYSFFCFFEIFFHILLYVRKKCIFAVR